MIGWRDRRVMIGPRCGHPDVDVDVVANAARNHSRAKRATFFAQELAPSRACGASLISVCTSTSREYTSRLPAVKIVFNLCGLRLR
jgi:hypothetical protein